MSELDDIKLRALLHEMQLEKPSSNFASLVMNRIIQEESAIEKIKKERILGKGFWVITVLFVVLLVLVFTFSGSSAGSGGFFSSIFSKFSGGVNQEYQSIFSKAASVPLSIAAILTAVSVLLFIDRIIDSNMKLFSGFSK